MAQFHTSSNAFIHTATFFSTSSIVIMGDRTQKALFLAKAALGNWKVGTRAIPKPGPRELLVKIHATALNPVDWAIPARGLVGGPFPSEYPLILGCDPSGEVEEVGEGVVEFKKGDRMWVSLAFVTTTSTTY